jgi:fatty acyl-CoA reductase
MAASKGVLRCMMIDRETVLNMIPCDLSINAFIMIAKQIGTMTQKPKTVPVYHLVTHESHKLKYGVIIDVIEEMRFKCPPAIMLWYPNTVLTRNEYYYKFNVFFFQWIPAYVVDFLFAMFGQKRL